MIIRFQGFALVLAIAGALGAAQGGEAEVRHYRWNGQAEGGFWLSAANWQVRADEDAWHDADGAPGEHDVVHLGDGPASAQPQRIALDTDVTVGRLVLDAADAERTYTIITRQDGLDDHLDSDSGTIYTLSLTDRSAIEQTERTQANLYLQVETRLLHQDGPRLHLYSAHAARLVIEQPLVTDGRLVIAGDGNASTGTIELRTSIAPGGFVLTGDARMLLSPPAHSGMLAFTEPGPIIDTDTLDTPGHAWRVVLNERSQGGSFVRVNKADVTDATLTLSREGGYTPEPGTSITLLRAAGEVRGLSSEAIFGYHDGETFAVDDVRFRIVRRQASDGATTVRLDVLSDGE